MSAVNVWCSPTLHMACGESSKVMNLRKNFAKNARQYETNSGKMKAPIPIHGFSTVRR